VALLTASANTFADLHLTVTGHAKPVADHVLVGLCARESVISAFSIVIDFNVVVGKCSPVREAD